MKTIDVKMPPGLDPQIESNWIEPKSPLSPSDEEYLLHKNFIRNCEDSSGCSSGQESVSSDSGSSITGTSDSGTEQPRAPTEEDPKELLMNIDALKSENPSYVQFPWNSNSVNSNGYSMYGIGDSNNPDIELTNVQTAENNSESAYTRCDQIMNVAEPRSNNSYVPLNNTQDKNPPYVMAASKSAVPSNQFYHKAYVQVADVNGVIKNGGNEVVDNSQVPNDDYRSDI